MEEEVMNGTDSEKILETITNNGFLWTDIQKPTNEKMTLLAKDYNFHELNVRRLSFEGPNS